MQRILHGWHQEGGQDRDDGNYDQQLDQRERPGTTDSQFQFQSLNHRVRLAYFELAIRRIGPINEISNDK